MLMYAEIMRELLAFYEKYATNTGFNHSRSREKQMTLMYMCFETKLKICEAYRF